MQGRVARKNARDYSYSFRFAGLILMPTWTPSRFKLTKAAQSYPGLGLTESFYSNRFQLYLAHIFGAHTDQQTVCRIKAYTIRLRTIIRSLLLTDAMNFSIQIASNIDFLMDYLHTNSNLWKYYIRKNLSKINYVKKKIYL